MLQSSRRGQERGPGQREIQTLPGVVAPVVAGLMRRLLFIGVATVLILGVLATWALALTGALNNPVNTSLPTITCPLGCSKVHVGQTLTGHLGHWTGAGTYNYYWQHEVAGTTTWSNVKSGTTKNVNFQPVYLIRTQDIGTRLHLYVVAFGPNTVLTHTSAPVG